MSEKRLPLGIRMRFLATVAWTEAKDAVLCAYPKSRVFKTLEGPYLVAIDEETDESLGMGFTPEEAWIDAASNL